MGQLTVEIAFDRGALEGDLHVIPTAGLEASGALLVVVPGPRAGLDGVHSVGPAADVPPVEMLGVLDAEQDQEPLVAGGLAGLDFVGVVTPLR